MKVDQDLRSIFEDQLQLNEELQPRVEAMVAALKSKSWHFESRLKSEESFAIKVEAGMVKDPNALEDFLAGVLVVPNLADVVQAEKGLLEQFQLVARRPRFAVETSKKSSDFPFDDLRMYLFIGTHDSLPPKRSDSTVFEIQIRTFLQHAWSVATHDVVYKTDSVSWGRERIAHQIKAILEHAEIAVESLPELEKSPSMPTVYQRYEQINRVIALLRSNWPVDELPVDLKRLATTILHTAESVADLDADGIGRLLDNGRARYGGAHNLNWSPYRTVLEYLATDYSARFKSYLGSRGHRRSIYMYRATADALGVKGAGARNAILLARPTEPI